MSTADTKPGIQLVLFDVDGVLTDGRLHMTGHGEFMKSFHAKDGVAIALLRAHGVRSGILSGKHSDALQYRAESLGMDVLSTGRHDKRVAYEQIKADQGLLDCQIAYVGDDINDLPVIDVVGLSYAPADAHALVRQQVDHVVGCVGGAGVARAVVEHLLLRSGLSIDDIYAPLLAQWSHHHVVQ
ncbi:HAD hydrolase family protein [Paraburkholderia sp.]|uniref:KdsC family phosphatase n=1 Tax=Paraburkholderia sp. TaxID=1926495 RepID=UPI00239AE8B4|nr:HAD hydrolase family protein [Paraburkholderia sp.]MDE1180428.1 HAD hydrolase family protein [Paraburkholderia sp.]